MIMEETGLYHLDVIADIILDVFYSAEYIMLL